MGNFAYGADATIIAAFEDTYGAAPASGNYFQVPAVSYDVGVTQNLGRRPGP